MLRPQSVEGAAVLCIPSRQSSQTATLHQAKQVLHPLNDMRVVAHLEAMLRKHPSQDAVVEQPIRLSFGP